MLPIGIPLLGSKVDQCFARRSCHLSQLQIHDGSGAAAKRPHVEGCELGVAHDEFNLLNRDMKFFRHSLA
jgi:hypothetical protein